MAVLTKMGAPVEDVMKGFDAPVDAILADSLLPWAPLIGKKREIPVSAFFPQSATMLLALLHLSSAGANGQSLPELVQSGNFLIFSRNKVKNSFIKNTVSGL